MNQRQAVQLHGETSTPDAWSNITGISDTWTDIGQKISWDKAQFKRRQHETTRSTLESAHQVP